MTFIRMWLFILTLLAGGSVYAADTCQALFRTSGALIDGRYGVTSQNDYYLEAEGLISEYGSKLCGPTCIENSLKKFHRILGLHFPENSPERIAKLIRDLTPLVDGEITTQGLDLVELGNVLRTALREDKIPARVHLFSSNESNHIYDGPVTRALLQASLRDDTFVIVGMGRYTNGGAFRRKSGHFIIVAGYNPDAPSEFYFLDPLSPRRFRRAELTTFNDHQRHFERQMLQLRFTDGGDADSTVLIEGAAAGRLIPQ